MRSSLRYWREVAIYAGCLAGLVGAFLFLAANRLGIAQIERENPLETALLGILFTAPYLLGLYGAMIVSRRRSYGLVAVGVATALSLVYALLAAFSVVGLAFAAAAALLMSGSAGLFSARWLPGRKAR